MSIPKPSISITAVSSSLLPEWHHDNHLETKDSQSSISSSSHSSEIYNFRSSFLLDIPTWMFRNHLKLKYPKQNSSSSHTSHPQCLRNPALSITWLTKLVTQGLLGNKEWLRAWSLEKSDSLGVWITVLTGTWLWVLSNFLSLSFLICIMEKTVQNLKSWSQNKGEIDLTLEQHRFELRRSIYIWILHNTVL